MANDVTKQVARYLSEAGHNQLPEEVAVKTSWHILDSLAAGISGSRIVAGVRAADYARAANHAGPSSLWGHRDTAEPVMAAFVNAMACHADETDDSHARSVTHPGCSVVPAAFAVAGGRPVSGDLLLRAVAAGYDLGTRMNMALGRDTFNMLRANTSSHAYGSIWGAVGAGTVVALLDAASAETALSYTTQLSSGVTTWLRDGAHVEKAFVFAGMPARNGVFAVTIAQAGWEGVPDAFDFAPNYFDAVSASPQPDILVDGLGRDFEIMQTNIKKYAVGSPAQAPVQAAEILIERHGIKADDVTRVEIKLPADSAHVTDNRSIPDINVQYLVAGTLVDGRLSFAMAHSEERMEEPAIRRLRDVSTITPDQTTVGTRSATLILTLADGRSVEEWVPFVRGTTDDPMSRAEVEAKSADLLDPVLGEANSRELIAPRVLDLASVANVATLAPLLQAG